MFASRKKVAMSAAQAFFVVGHAHWGKSETLAALTSGSHYVRHHAIGVRDFFIRRTSNDDWPDRWETFLDALVPAKHPHVILTVCPHDAALPVLQRLRARYDLYFWVIHESWDGQLMITSTEEQSLRALGPLEVFRGHHDAPVRARAFERFVAAHL